MSYKVGIIGATGAVGREMIDLLLKEQFPMVDLRLFASARSAGKEITVRGTTWKVQETDAKACSDLDIVLMSAGGSISRALGRELQAMGCLVIDNSSAFRMEPDVPLIVPEINAQDMIEHQGLIANPNCSTAIALMGLYPLHKEFNLKGFFAVTYQAVSGTGAAAMQELEEQVKAWQKGDPPKPSVYPHPIAFNLLPHAGNFEEDGYTDEEKKMYRESKKILNLKELRVSTTCVRVPVFRNHSIAIHAEFEKEVDLDQARNTIYMASGVEFNDNPAENRYPMPIDYVCRGPCGVGRLRRDSFFENGLALWVVGDQLWKGAALNAVQIAQLAVK